MTQRSGPGASSPWVAMLSDALGRIRPVVLSAVRDASVEALTFRADTEANSVGWLVWHLTRVQDSQVAPLAGLEQVWIECGWVERFGLPFATPATGYGQSAAEVGAVRADALLLAGYYEAVHERTIGFVRTLSDDDLARVVDTSWTPAVTLAARLVSTLADDLQHAGQASYVRGLARRAGLD